MTNYVCYIWNGEDYEDSQDAFIIVNAKDELIAKEKAEFIINTEKALEEISARDEKTGYGVWQIIPYGYFYNGEVTAVKTLQEVIVEGKEIIQKAKDLRKQFLADKESEEIK